ncbi:hypothetical protein Tco_0054743, partial [Tanacetum coccineum]
MGLLDFVKSSDPSKVKTGEQTLASDEFPLLTETADVNKRKVGASSILPPVKKARTGGVSIKEPAVTTAGKSPTVIQKLIKQANVDSGGAASHAEEFVSSSVTLTPERDCEDESVSNHEDNVRTCPPGRYVVLSSSSMDTDNLNSPQVIPSALSVQANIDVVATQPSGATHDSSAPVMKTIDSATAQNIYVPNWDVTNSARMDDPIMCSNLVDHVPPLGYWASLRNLNDAEFLDWVNYKFCSTCLYGSELRLCYEHEITMREKFEKKFVDSSEVIQQRDAEIVELKSKLRKAE